MFSAVLRVPANAGLEDVTCHPWALFELRMFGLTTPVGLVGGHSRVSALIHAGLQPLHLPDVGATPQQGEGLAPHLYLLVLAIAREFVQKQKAINVAGQEVLRAVLRLQQGFFKGFSYVAKGR